MPFHKSNLFIVIAFIIVGLIVVYVVVQDKQPSEEFTSLTDTSTSTKQSDSQETSSATQQQVRRTISVNPEAQEGSFGLLITSPSVEEQLNRGEKHIIRWEGIFIDRVKISLRSPSTGTNIPVISNLFASVQKYEWTVPTTLIKANDYYFVIVPQIQSYSKAAASADFGITDLAVVSPITSKIEAASFTVSAEPNCFTTITVKALNKFGLPVAGKKVSLTASRPTVQTITVFDTTSSDGSAIFRVGSQIQGTVILNASIEGVIVNDTGSISFITPPPFCNTR